MDNIVFEKIWIDETEDFFEIKVTARNDRVMMSSSGYATSKMIRELQQGIKDILKRPFSVEFSNSHDSRVRFSFLPDVRGTVYISIFMKNETNCSTTETATFTVQTEVALLDRFSQKLDRIIEGDVGEIAYLVDTPTPDDSIAS